MRVFYLLLFFVFFSIIPVTGDDNLNVPFSTVEGKYLGIYNGVDGYTPIFVKGVNLGVGVPGTWPGQLEVTKLQYARWLRMIADAGFNVIRIYTIHFPEFYEAFKNYNEENPDKPLYLLHGVWLSEDDLLLISENDDLYMRTEEFDDEIKDVIDCIHGNNHEIPFSPGKAYGTYTADISPWTLGYIIGREIHADEVEYTNSKNSMVPANFYGEHLSIEGASPTEVWVAKRIDELIAYEIDNYNTTRPVANSSWPTLDPISHWSEESGSREDDEQIDMSKLVLDNAPGGYFASYHAYPYYPNFMNDDYDNEYNDEFKDDEGLNNYFGYLKELKSHYEDYPLLITEFGVPTSYYNAFRSVSGMNHGGMTEEEQGNYNIRMLKNIHDTDCGGGIMFAWMDEWFKRTWINEPTYTGRRNLWHNLTAAENNFGLIRFAPSQLYYDNRETEQVAMTKLSEVDIWHDFVSFNADITLESPIIAGDTLWIAFDTYERNKGESTLPNGKRVLDNNRAEFLLRITPDSANFYVTKAYNLFGLSLKKCEAESYQTKLTDGEPWELLRWNDGAQGYKNYPFITDVGKFAVCFGDNVPKTHEFVHIKDDGISFRIPWTLLNINDPSLPTVIDDDETKPLCDNHLACEFNYLNSLATTGVALTLVFNNGNDIDDEIAELSPYIWDEWDVNENSIFDPSNFFEKEKESLAIITEGLHSVPFVEINDNAERPVIVEQPFVDDNIILFVGDNLTLSVSATSPDGGNLSYQWYINDANINYLGTLIPEATEAEYSPNTFIGGTTYYYVRVTNTNESVTGITTASTTSIAVAVTLQKIFVTITDVTALDDCVYNELPQIGYTGVPVITIDDTGEIIDTEIEILYQLVGDDEYVDTEPPRNAGNYIITFKIPDNDETYTCNPVFLNFTIAKDDYNMSNVIFANKTFEYDGLPHSIEIAGLLPLGVDVLEYTDNEQTEIGTYTVTVSFEQYDEDNYNKIPDMTATLKIVDKLIPVTISGITVSDDLIYNELPQKGFEGTPVVVDDNEQIIDIEPELLYESTDGKNYFNADPPVNAGDYKVTIKIPGDNDTYIGELILNFTIDKADYDMSEVIFANKTVEYDGTPHSILVTGHLPLGVDVLEYTDNEQTEIGTYTVTVSFEQYDEDNYNKVADMTATLKIVDKLIPVTISGITVSDDLIYNELPQKGFEGTPVVVDDNEQIIDIELEILYESTDGKNYFNASPPVNAGDYKVTIKIPGDNDTYTGELILNFTIDKADYNMSEVIFANKTVEYDGTPHSILITGLLPHGVDVLEYTDNEQTEIGTYTVTVSFEQYDEDNYNKVADMTATLKIVDELIPVTISGITVSDDLIYNEEPQGFTGTPVVTRTDNEQIIDIEPEILYESTDGKNYFNANPPVNAGDYKVTIKIPGDNDTYTGELILNFTIDKADYYMSEVIFANKTVEYDGTPHSILVTGHLPLGVDVLAYSGNAQTAIGEYIVTVSFEQYDEDNYNKIPDMTATLKIVDELIPVTISGITVSDDLIYNEEPQGFTGTPVVTRTDNEQIVDIELEILYESTDGKNYFNVDPPVNAGDYKVTIKIPGDNDTYTGELIFNFTIAKADYDMSNIVFASKTVEYDGSPHSILITGLLPLGVVVLDYSGNEQTDVGEYIVTVSFEQYDEDNYNKIPDMTATLKIVDYLIPVTISEVTVSDDYVYNEEPQGISGTPVITRNDNGQIVNIAPEILYESTDDKTYFSSNAPTNAGVYKVTIKIPADNDTYKGELILNFTIDKADYDMSEVIFANKTVEYDGSPHSILVTGVLPHGVDVLDYSGNEKTDVGEYIVTVSFEQYDEDNYNKVADMTATLKIVDELIPVTISGITVSDDLIYNEEPQGFTGTPVVTRTDNEQIIDIELEILYESTDGKNYFNANPPVNAGAYKVTIKIPADNDIYVGELILNFTIDKADYNMSNVIFANKTVEYDGLPHSILIAGHLPLGVDVLVYTNNALTAIGDYIVTVSFKQDDEDNYNKIPDMTATLKIVGYNLVPVTITGIDVSDDFFYNEEPQGISGTPVIKRADNGQIVDIELEILYESTDGENYFSADPPVNAGYYQVTIKIPDDNETYSGELVLYFTIAKADYDMSNVIFASKTVEYDGSPHSILVTGHLPLGVDVLAYSGNEQTDIGEYIVTVSFEQYDEDNYNLISNMHATLKIVGYELKPVTISGITVSDDLIYNELPQKGFEGTPVVTRTDNAQIIDIELEILYESTDGKNYFSADPPAFAGDYKVTIKIPADNDIYVGELILNFTIAKADYDMSNVVFASKTVEYDGSPHSILVTGILPLGVDVLAYSGNAQTAIGEYIVTVSFEQYDEDNYNKIPDMTATLKIVGYNLVPVTISGITVSDDLIYNELPQGFTGTPIVTQTDNAQIIDIELAILYESTDGKNYFNADPPAFAGDYKVTIKIPDDDDTYTGELILNFTIAKADYDMSNAVFASKTVEYDGSPHSIVVTGILPLGVDVLKYTDNEHTEIGEYIATVSFEQFDEINYNKIPDMTATLKIVGYDLIPVTIAGINISDNFIYNEMPQKGFEGTPVATRIDNGQIVNITLIILYESTDDNEYYDSDPPRNVGDYKVSIKIPDDNELYTCEPFTSYYTVAKANYDMKNVEFAGKTVTYDGEAHSIFVSGLPAGVEVLEYIGNGQIQIGEYPVTARFKQDDENNYHIVADMTAILKIVPITNSGEMPSITPLKAWIQDGTLYISGLPNGSIWSVYTISGALFYRGIADNDPVEMPLSVQGIYIIQSENETVKVSNF